MQNLIEGIIEFREQRRPELVQRFRDLADGQTPDTLFISCSDSRVVPSLLLSSEPGDLFIMRNVGNLMPPSTREGASTGDLSEASAIEYAVMVLKVDNIVVCGHSGCGAMKAALSGDPMTETPNLALWLKHAEAATTRLKEEGPLDSRLPDHDQLSQINVLVQLEHLRTYPIVQQKTASGELQLGGWWFDIGQGEMSAYNPGSDRFEPIDRHTAPRLMKQHSTATPHCIRDTGSP
jgi:carbonic anhydrase